VPLDGLAEMEDPREAEEDYEHDSDAFCWDVAIGTVNWRNNGGIRHLYASRWKCRLVLRESEKPCTCLGMCMSCGDTCLIMIRVLQLDAFYAISAVEVTPVRVTRRDED